MIGLRAGNYGSAERAIQRTYTYAPFKIISTLNGLMAVKLPALEGVEETGASDGSCQYHLRERVGSCGT